MHSINIFSWFLLYIHDILSIQEILSAVYKTPKSFRTLVFLWRFSDLVRPVAYSFVPMLPAFQSLSRSSVILVFIPFVLYTACAPGNTAIITPHRIQKSTPHTAGTCWLTNAEYLQKEEIFNSSTFWLIIVKVINLRHLPLQLPRVSLNNNVFIKERFNDLGEKAGNEDETSKCPAEKTSTPWLLTNWRERRHYLFIYLQEHWRQWWTKSCLWDRRRRIVAGEKLKKDHCPKRPLVWDNLLSL